MSMSSCSGPLNTGQSEEVPVLELETFWTEEEEEEDRGRRKDCGDEMEGGGGAMAGISLREWLRLSLSRFDFRSSHLTASLLLLGLCFSPASSLLGDLRCLTRGGSIIGGVLWSRGTLGAAASGERSRL